MNATLTEQSNFYLVENEVVTPGDDALYGIKAIAEFIGRTPRQTHYLLYEGRIPAGKEGVLWRASKKALRAHYEKLSSEIPSDKSVH